MIGTIKKDRKSVFREVGLDADDSDTMDIPASKHVTANHSDETERITGLTPLDTKSVGGDLTTDAVLEEESNASGGSGGSGDSEAQVTQTIRQVQQSDSSLPSEPLSPESPTSKIPWYSILATGKRPRVKTGSNAPPSPFKPLSTVTMLALAVAVLAPLIGRMGREPMGVADAGVVRVRVDSPTDVCSRWAQQSAYKQELFTDTT